MVLELNSIDMKKSNLSGSGGRRMKRDGVMTGLYIPRLLPTSKLPLLANHIDITAQSSK